MSISFGRPSTYLTVTCDFASGRSQLQLARLAQLRLTLDEAVREIDRQRHQLRRLIARITEHQSLIACALIEIQAAAFVDALRDVGRLLVVRDQHGAALVVDAVVGVVIADALDRLARDALVIDHRVRGDLAGEHDQARVAQRFRRDARIFVLRQDRIEDRVRDLIGDLVRMAFGDRFGRKQKAVAHVLT